MKSGHWRELMRSFIHFLSGTLLSRVTGFARDIATAYAFGAEPSVAALMVAFRLSHILRRLLGEGALQNSFTPHYEELKLKDHAAAQQFFRDLRGGLVLLLIILIAVGMIGMGAILWCDICPNSWREVTWLTLLLSPGLLFICLYGLYSALLQCEGAYWASGAAPAWLNIGWIAGALSFQELRAQEAMPLLALCIVAATALQWLATLPRTHRNLTIVTEGWRRCSPLSPAVRRLWRPLLYGMTGIAASQLNSAADSFFGLYADPSGPAYLWYAIRLEQLPLALFGIAIANSLSPPLCRAAKRGEHMVMRQLISYASGAILLFMLPAALFLFAFAHSLVSWTYAHGHFESQAIAMTEACLRGYALGLPPAGLILCLAPAFYATGDYRLPMRASLTSVALNILLNALCIGTGMGVASVAWATTFSSWANCAFLLWNWQRRTAISPCLVN